MLIYGGTGQAQRIRAILSKSLLQTVSSNKPEIFLLVPFVGPLIVWNCKVQPEKLLYTDNINRNFPPWAQIRLLRKTNYQENKNFLKLILKKLNYMPKLSLKRNVAVLLSPYSNISSRNYRI